MKRNFLLFGTIIISIFVISLTACPPGNDNILTYALLDAAIDSANAAKTNVLISTDGSELTNLKIWVTQQQMDALNAAIANAVTAKAQSTTQAQVDDAVSTLNSMVTIFNAAKQPGAIQVVIRWSFWGSQPRIDNAQSAINLFTERTGIIVNVETQGVTEHFQKFMTELAAGNAADVIQLGGHFRTLEINDNGTNAPGVENYMLPLTQFVNSGIIDTSQLDDLAIQAGTRDGILYALPLGINMPAIIYNKSALERVGVPLPNTSMTWEGFEEWMGIVKPLLPADTWVLTDCSIVPSSFMFFSYWAGVNNTPLYNGTNTQLTAEEVQKYFELWNGWRSAGYVPSAAISTGYSETDEAALVAGKTIATINWSNSLSYYQTLISDELGLIELPNAAVNQGLWTQVNQMIGISAGSANGEAAAMFINFRAINPDAWAITGADPGFPSTSAARDAIATDPVSQKIVEYISTAVNHTSPVGPIIPNESEFNSVLRTIAQKAASGEITAAQAGQEVMALINEHIGN